jgi:Flp pilus assembly pilin Flp
LAVVILPPYHFLKTSIFTSGPGRRLITPRFCDLSSQCVREESVKTRRKPVANFLRKLWNDESGQDIAEYAVMLAVILVIVVGTVRLIGSNANNVFSNVASSIQ